MSPLFVSGSCLSGSRRLTERLGREPAVSPIHDADFVARLLWIFMVHTGEDRKRMIVRCISDTLRVLEKTGRDLHGDEARRLNIDRTEMACRTGDLLDQLDCGLGILALREFLGGLFQAHCAQDNKPVWVCNSVLLSHMLPQLQGLFPNLHMVHVIRPGEQIFPMAKTFPERFPGQYLRVDGSSLDARADEVVKRILEWATQSTPRPAGAHPRAA